MRGIIMEIKGTRCVILKKDGTFAEIRNRNYAVGQEVSTSNPAIGKALSAAACLAVICTAAFGYHLYYTPASYVYMDINPSVRLDLNCFERVIDVVPLNEDAEVLLSNVTVRKGSAEECMNTSVSACQEQNYLNEHNTDIEVSVRTDSAKLETEVETASAAIGEEQLEVSVFQMDEEENDSAMEHHISAKRLRAMRAYTAQFGGTIDENLALLRGYTNDEIFTMIREARRSQELGSDTPQNAAPSDSSATPAKPVETPSTATHTEPEETLDNTKDHAGTEIPAPTSPAPAPKYQLPAKRLEAIRAYTEQFGGTLEENVKWLQGISSPEIYRMIEEAQAAQENGMQDESPSAAP